MIKDMFGTNRLKINLHLHTTQSDGHKTPEEAAAIYREAGYDIIAITDHWKYRESGAIGGLHFPCPGRSTISAAATARRACSTSWPWAAAGNRISLERPGPRP